MCSSDLKVTPGKIGNTTSTFYPDADPESTSVDGNINHVAITWATTHDALTGISVDMTTADAVGVSCGETSTPNEFQIIRGFFLFDTSALPDGDNITSATFSFYVTAVSDQDNDAQGYANVYAATPASNTDLVTADYDQIGATAQSDGNVDLTGLGTGAYANWVLNATGRGSISKTGVTKFGLREGHDAENVEYAGGDNTNNRITGSHADTAGTTQDPKLVVVHAAVTTPKMFLVF